MMQTAGANLASKRATNVDDNRFVAMRFGVICPSVCPSDWDKRKTPVTNSCSATTYDERQNEQRRGQDSAISTFATGQCADLFILPGT